MSGHFIRSPTLRIVVNPDRIPFGIRSLDALLGGGLETGSLTQLYGEGGTGKTNLCIHMACKTTMGGKWVVYVDTEGLSLERVSQVAQGMGTTLSSVIKKTLLTSPKSLEEQERAVVRASRMMMQKEGRIGLVILDSATLLYRLALGQEDEDVARQSLSSQLATLLHAALETGIPVVMTNQVWRDIATSTFEPIGGSFVNHIAKTTLRVEKLKDGWRRIVLMKHRSLPEGGKADFLLAADGLRSP